MSNLIKVVIAILLVVYPILVYYGLNNDFSGEQLGIILLVLFTIRSFFTRLKTNRDKVQQIFPIVMVTGLVVLTWLFNSPEYLLWYPVGLNILFLLLFGSSVIYPPTIIETIASKVRKDMPPEVVVYTRKVTIAWCIFFAFNTVVSSWTVLSGSIEYWTLFNGLISYFIALAIVGIEYAIRKLIIHRKLAQK